MEDIEPTDINWMWSGYFPLGMVSLIEGDPGLGKSTVALDLAARISSGAPMPDGSVGIDGSVAVLTAEDDLSCVVRPRLHAMGADLSRIHPLLPATNGDLLSLPDDADAIRNFVLSIDCRLVILDPIVAFLSDKTNSFKNHDVRRALAPLTSLASDTGASVIMIRHLNKRSDQKAIHRGGGSIAFNGVARCTFQIAKEPGNPTSRVMAPVKFNIGPDPQTWSFAVEPSSGSSRIHWNYVSSLTADELDDHHPIARPASAGAIAFLKSELAGKGWVETREIQKRAAARGISWTTVDRARQRLGVEAKKQGKRWFMRLPTQGDDGGGVLDEGIDDSKT